MRQVKDLPDIFTFFDGSKVKTREDWERRRVELREWFQNNVYGVFPKGAEKGFTFKVVSDRIVKNARIKTVSVEKGDYKADFNLYLPIGVIKPAVLVFGVNRVYESKFNFDDPEDFTKEPSKTTLPISEILDRGYAVAPFFTTKVAMDNGTCYEDGVCKHFIGERTENSAGAIAAWAFFISRMADYFETDPDVDATRLGVLGHSRGGKMALYTAVADERFGFAYVSNSGCTGASIARENYGETIQLINHGYPYWFDLAYRKYSDHEYDMPVDFHELCALVAPRLMYITSSSEDAWACPDNEFLSANLAGEVYEKIYNIKGLVADDEPVLDKAYQDGNLAYHKKTGGHSFDYSDWQKCLDFLDKKGWSKKK